MNGAPAFRTAFVGSDFSRGATAALRLAVAWASWREARLEAVHVTDATSADMGAAAALSQHLGRQLEAAGADRLGRPPGVSITAGRPADVLAALAATVPGAFLVVGSEGTSAHLMRLAGSTTEALALATSLPVLVAPPAWEPLRSREGVRTAPFSRALVATCGGPRDEELVRAGVGLCVPHGLEVALARSIDVSPQRGYPPDQRRALGQRAQEAAREAEDAARDLLERALGAEHAGVAVPVHVTLQGPPWRDLAGLAESQSADLVVIGQGRTAARLCATTPCPLLVL